MRTLTIAQNAFWQVMRDRILYVIGIFALLMIGAVRLLPEISATTENKITLDFGLAAIDFLSLIITIFASTSLINQEIEKRTVYLLVAKPISRLELIVGKYLGLSAVLFVLIAGMMLIYFIILSWNKIPYPGLSLTLSGLFLGLKLSLMVAVGLLFGVLTNSLLATLLTLGVYLMGSLSRDLLNIGQFSENLTIERLMTGLYLILPDLARLDLKNDAVYGQFPSLAILFTNIAYGFLYTILLLSIAIGIFSRREF
jgi:ABC-type transport system involved in multi-copper enzyme maturation permease subunit